MPTSTDLKQRRAAVWAEIIDLRGKKDENGSFADAATAEHYRKASASFDTLTTSIRDAEAEEARESLLIEREYEQRQRTTQNTSATAAPATAERSATYDGAFMRWVVQNPDRPTISQDEVRLLNTRRAGEYRAGGTDPQVSDVAARGGYLVPESFVAQIEVMMKHYGGMLEAGETYNDPIGGVLRYPTGDDTGQTGNVRTPQGTSSVTQDMTFGRVLFGDYSVDSGIVKLSEEFMQDERAGFTSQVLMKNLSARIGRKVNTMLTNGTGTNESYGLATTVTNSALTSATATAITKAELNRAVHKIDKAYRGGPKFGWMMHDSILGYLKGLDLGNSDTVHLFFPSIAAGVPDTLLGYPVFVNNDLEAAHATTGLPVTAKKHIYLGDFSKYVVRRIKEVSISRNDFLYWEQREVGFMGWLRIDGNLINANAIKYILQA